MIAAVTPLPDHPNIDFMSVLPSVDSFHIQVVILLVIIMTGDFFFCILDILVILLEDSAF